MKTKPSKPTMTIWPLFCAAGCLIASLYICGCSPEQTAEAGQVVAKINKYKLTQGEYQAKLARELEYDREYKCTAAARKDFLDRLIRQEVLIQEAVNRNLDKAPEFMAAIEKYWEATLIKNLMAAKMEEIRQTTLVSEGEIKARYQELKTGKENMPPLNRVEKKIADILKEEKQTAEMEQWVSRLKKEAKIKVFEKRL
ncbi:MAG: SurA N-terminal domain-containing protein [Desulfobacter sp.]|nr:MAG: SurA N-terminal domain-containing protein [Desulfobacter sp.]